MSAPDKSITSITLQYPPGGGKTRDLKFLRLHSLAIQSKVSNYALGPRHRTMRPSAPGMHPLLAVHRPDTADTHSSGLVCNALLLLQHLYPSHVSHRSASQLLEVSLHGFQPTIQGLGNRPYLYHQEAHGKRMKFTNHKIHRHRSSSIINHQLCCESMKP